MAQHFTDVWMSPKTTPPQVRLCEPCAAAVQLWLLQESRPTDSRPLTPSRRSLSERPLKKNLISARAGCYICASFFLDLESIAANEEYLTDAGNCFTVYELVQSTSLRKTFLVLSILDSNVPASVALGVPSRQSRFALEDARNESVLPPSSGWYLRANGFHVFIYQF